MKERTPKKHVKLEDRLVDTQHTLLDYTSFRIIDDELYEGTLSPTAGRVKYWHRLGKVVEEADEIEKE